MVKDEDRSVWFWIGAFAVVISLSIILTGLEAGVLMVILYGLSQFVSWIPAFGFVECFWIVLALNFLGAILGRPRG